MPGSWPLDTHAVSGAGQLSFSGSGTLLRMLAALLEPDGWTVLQAHDGGEVSDQIERHCPAGGELAVLLMDPMVPRESGVAVLCDPRERDPRVPSIVVSAH
jgi:DNA-binding response OmpR family regulator